MLKAVFNKVIVEKQEFREKSYGNIIVPDAGKEKGLRGKVVSVGEGMINIMGNLIQTKIKEGDIVILPPIGPVSVEENGKEYLICEENLILAIITE